MKAVVASRDADRIQNTDHAYQSPETAPCPASVVCPIVRGFAIDCFSQARRATFCLASDGAVEAPYRHPVLRFHCASCAASRGEIPQLACDPAQRPTAAHQQGYRFPLELIRNMTLPLSHSTPFRSGPELSKAVHQFEGTSENGATEIRHAELLDERFRSNR
jgi:hypothetical protein